MGVDRTDYLMWGVDVGADNFDLDKHEAEASGGPSRKFDVVYDAMGGNYCIAGKILAESGGYDGDGFDMIAINHDELNVDRGALAAIVSEAFDQKRCAEDFKLVLFSHFS